MPYIDPDSRERLSYNSLDVRITGELNYVLTKVCLNYTNKKGLSYRSINDVLGALEGVKQEYYRRVAIPYEEQKMKDNGDVY